MTLVIGIIKSRNLNLPLIFPGILLAISAPDLDVTKRNDDAILAGAISRLRLELGVHKSDQIHFSMCTATLLPGVWSNIELLLIKNRA